MLKSELNEEETTTSTQSSNAQTTEPGPPPQELPIHNFQEMSSSQLINNPQPVIQGQNTSSAPPRALTEAPITSSSPSTSTSECEAELENLTINVKEIHNFQSEVAFIGKIDNYLALKNESSYLFATFPKRLQLVEDKTLVYSGQVQGSGLVRDVIYIKHFDCYLLSFNSQLYRKDIDGRPAYLFMAVNCGIKSGVSFKYSEVNNRLVIIKEEECSNKIAIINLKRKDVEILAKKPPLGKIVDFGIFGEDEAAVVSLANTGRLMLDLFNYSVRKLFCSSCSEIDLIKKRKEKGFSLSVSGQHNYALVEIMGKASSSFKSSRMIVFQIQGKRLVNKAVIDLFSQGIEVQCALECFGAVEGQIVWVGLSWVERGVVTIFVYDYEQGEFKEVGRRRVAHQEDHPYKVELVDNHFYYTGRRGRVMKLGLIF